MPSPAISRSMSAGVLWTANDARVVALVPEPAHQRLGAVMAGAHADPLAAEDLADVVRVCALELERDQGAAVGGVGRAMNREAGDLAQPGERLADEPELVLADPLDPERGDPVDRGAEADRLGDLRGARLELPRQVGPGRLVGRDGPDHVAAADERRHLLEQLAAAVQHADPGRPVGLVPGPGVEVGVDRAQIDGDLRHRLAAVDQRHRAGVVRAGDDRLRPG